MAVALGVLTLALALPGLALAHTALCTCFDNADGTITCEGGFSDGSSASGVGLIVKDGSGKVIEQGAMDKTSKYTFKKPEGAYSVVYDAGEGHKIEIDGKKILE
ncbi:hypothetical protein [Solidesulfovibrio sp.]